MAKDKNQDQYSELQFPLNGLYLATENETPPPNTTPVGSNVRTFETLTGRGRGGSRPGLKQYIPDQLIPGVKVQHLAVIIDPQSAALFGGFGDNSSDPGRNADGGSGGYPPVRWHDQAGRVSLVSFRRDLITITANNQTKVYGTVFTFTGTEFTQSGSVLDPVATVTLTSTGSAAAAHVVGSPYPIIPSRPVGTNLQNYRFTFVNGAMTVTPEPIAYVTSKKTFFGDDFLTFNPVRIGDLLVVGIQQFDGAEENTVGITDNQGNTWTKIKEVVQEDSLESQWIMSIWWAKPIAAGSLTLTMTGDNLFRAIAGQWHGVHGTTTPEAFAFDSGDEATDDAPEETTVSTGMVTVPGVTPGLLVGFLFVWPDVNGVAAVDFELDVGITLLDSFNGMITTDFGMVSILPISASAELSGLATAHATGPSGPPFQGILWIAIGASFSRGTD